MRGWAREFLNQKEDVPLCHVRSLGTQVLPGIWLRVGRISPLSWVVAFLFILLLLLLFQFSSGGLTHNRQASEGT